MRQRQGDLRRLFVCSDPDLIKFNVTCKVTKVLEDAGLAYEIYSNIKPNPTIENVQTRRCGFQGIRSRLYHCHWRRFLHGYLKGNRRYHHQP